jgi:hypothetical protein
MESSRCSFPPNQVRVRRTLPLPKKPGGPQRGPGHLPRQPPVPLTLPRLPEESITLRTTALGIDRGFVPASRRNGWHRTPRPSSCAVGLLAVPTRGGGVPNIPSLRRVRVYGSLPRKECRASTEGRDVGVPASDAACPSEPPTCELPSLWANTPAAGPVNPTPLMLASAG